MRFHILPMTPSAKLRVAGLHALADRYDAGVAFQRAHSTRLFSPAEFSVLPDPKNKIYKSTDYLDANGSSDPSTASKTPEQMNASLKAMKDELWLSRPINHKDFKAWTELGRSIASHARYYGRTNTSKFIGRSGDALNWRTIGVTAEEREEMVAYFLKAKDIQEKWSLEGSASESSNGTHTHLPSAQVQRQDTDPPAYDAPPPYSPL